MSRENGLSCTYIRPPAGRGAVLRTEVTTMHSNIKRCTIIT